MKQMHPLSTTIIFQKYNLECSVKWQLPKLILHLEIQNNFYLRKWFKYLFYKIAKLILLVKEKC